MDKSLESWMDLDASVLMNELTELSREDMPEAFDKATIVARNVRPQGVRMPLILEFFVANSEAFMHKHTGHSALFPALGIVGEYSTPGKGFRKKAAQDFNNAIVKINDPKRAQDIAYATKAHLSKGNPVRAAALDFILQQGSEVLENLVFNASELDECEQEILLDAILQKGRDDKSGLKRMLGIFIDECGYASPAGSKAYDMLDEMRRNPDVVFGIMNADGNAMTYVLENGDSVDVPLDRNLQ